MGFMNLGEPYLLALEKSVISTDPAEPSEEFAEEENLIGTRANCFTEVNWTLACRHYDGVHDEGTVHTCGVLPCSLPSQVT